MIKWSDDMIKEYYDTHCEERVLFRVILKHYDVITDTLSIVSGRTKAEIKNILSEKR